MKKETKGKFFIAICLLTAFALWSVAIQIVDVQAIGPQGSSVGFATLNRLFHSLTGVHMSLYVITDWLGLVPLLFAFGFAMLGLTQWIKRKHLLKVDRSLLALGGFYIAVMAVYILFEILTVNYRPVLIGGVLEASYPSSTTVLALCVMPTAAIQLSRRTPNGFSKTCVMFALNAFAGFMVVGRLVSGVHWLTDIVGGVLLSAGLVLLYRAVICLNVCEDTREKTASSEESPKSGNPQTIRKN